MQKQSQKTKHVPYKYRILELLDKLPYRDHKMAMSRIPIAIGVSKTTFSDWRYIKEDSSRMIPAEKLYLIATFFGVEVKDMFNTPPTSIDYDQMRLEYEEEKKEKFNLK